jgi:hypothetical protein
MASPSAASLKTYIPHIILVTQLLSACSHIYITTLLILTISAESTLGVLSPAYITIFLLFALTLTLLIHTLISLLNGTLTPTSYSHLQNLSLSLYLITLLILSILSFIPSSSPNDAGELVTGLLAITAIAGYACLLNFQFNKLTRVQHPILIWDYLRRDHVEVREKGGGSGRRRSNSWRSG